MWKVMKVSFDDSPDEMINIFGCEMTADTYIEEWRDYNFDAKNLIVLYTEKV